MLRADMVAVVVESSYGGCTSVARVAFPIAAAISASTMTTTNSATRRRRRKRRARPGPWPLIGSKKIGTVRCASDAASRGQVGVNLDIDGALTAVKLPAIGETVEHQA